MTIWYMGQSYQSTVYTHASHTVPKYVATHTLTSSWQGRRGGLRLSSWQGRRGGLRLNSWQGRRGWAEAEQLAGEEGWAEAEHGLCRIGESMFQYVSRIGRLGHCTTFTWTC